MYMYKLIETYGSDICHVGVKMNVHRMGSIVKMTGRKTLFKIVSGVFRVTSGQLSLLVKRNKMNSLGLTLH